MKLDPTVRIIWLLTFATFIGVGVGLVWWPASRTVAQLRLEASHYYDEANENEADVRHASQLQAVEERVQADLQSLTVAASQAQATSALVETLAKESGRYHVSVHSIVPQSATPPPSGAFEKSSVQLALSGRFADVLHFVAQLPRRGLLISIDSMALAASDRHRTSPMLTVTLNTTLYRFRGHVGSGGLHAAATSV